MIPNPVFPGKDVSLRSFLHIVAGGRIGFLVFRNNMNSFTVRLCGEMHVRETVAAVMARKAEERAGCVRAKVQLRPHAVHRVDHAAELRDEERIHHARGRQGEVKRDAGRNHKLVHARNTLVRVDEEPLPIQRNALDLKRWRV